MRAPVNHFRRNDSTKCGIPWSHTFLNGGGRFCLACENNSGTRSKGKPHGIPGRKGRGHKLHGGHND